MDWLFTEEPEYPPPTTTKNEQQNKQQQETIKQQNQSNNSGATIRIPGIRAVSVCNRNVTERRDEWPNNVPTDSDFNREFVVERNENNRTQSIDRYYYIARKQENELLSKQQRLSRFDHQQQQAISCENLLQQQQYNENISAIPESGNFNLTSRSYSKI